MKINPVLALATLLVLPACTTVQEDLTAKIVARRATIEILKAHPDYRPAFTASVLSIDLLLKKSGATRAEFIAAIQALKIRELKGANGSAIVADILDLIDIAVGQKPWIGDGLPRLKSLLVAVSDGMADGLALTIQ